MVIVDTIVVWIEQVVNWEDTTTTGTVVAVVVDQSRVVKCSRATSRNRERNE